MKKIDVFNHFFPARYFEKMMEVAGTYADMGKRVRNIPCLIDLDLRFKIMDEFGEDYVQLPSIANPPPDVMAEPAVAAELARIGNDGLAELAEKHPDRFPSFVATVALSNPDEAVKEAERSVKELKAAGVQIFSNVAGKPIDRPEFEPFFAKMEELERAVWIHPARGANFPDYVDEPKSKYEIWWTFGWPYETSAAMARLVFSGILDRYPKLDLVIHHLGAMVPYFECRVGPGWDQLGARTSDEDLTVLLKELNKRPLDYFKEMHADSAVFGSASATRCGLDFYGADKVLFASDSPFDPEKGPGYIRETIKIIDGLDISDDDRRKIYVGNIERLTRQRFE
ncbi:MAG TPA: amidohydrolase family protein [Hyphomicrobiales bacterium]|nr:amidohydrolase family protein [Hyphomicrobiales bacterium]